MGVFLPSVGGGAFLHRQSGVGLLGCNQCDYLCLVLPHRYGAAALAMAALNTVHCTVYTVHIQVCRAHCTLYKYGVHTVHCVLYRVQCTVYTVEPLQGKSCASVMLGNGPACGSQVPGLSVQCSAVQCSAVQCRAVHCSALQCSAMHCSAVQCGTVRYSAVQCSAVQCGTVQCSVG